MNVPKSHPRYKSLKARERLSALSDKGVVARTGLIAHGRGEAFDYFLGERTSPEGELAIKVAAYRLVSAEHPVLSINGNVAALAGKEMIALSKAVPAPLEVNLFHRTRERIGLVADYLEMLGAKDLLGREARKRIPGLEQPRGLCTEEGIYSADAVLVPLEDGDRAQALKKMGKLVIAIDLNPLSRTAIVADITIVDELTRAIPLLAMHVKKAKKSPASYKKLAVGYDNARNLAAVRKRMAANMARGK